MPGQFYWFNNNVIFTRRHIVFYFIYGLFNFILQNLWNIFWTLISNMRNLICCIVIDFLVKLLIKAFDNACNFALIRRNFVILVPKFWICRPFGSETFILFYYLCYVLQFRMYFVFAFEIVLLMFLCISTINFSSIFQ